jgi:hypothetical protein
MLNTKNANKLLSESAQLLLKAAETAGLKEPLPSALRLIHTKGLDADLQSIGLKKIELAAVQGNDIESYVKRAIANFQEVIEKTNYVKNGGLNRSIFFEHPIYGMTETSFSVYCAYCIEQIETIAEQLKPQ